MYQPYPGSAQMPERKRPDPPAPVRNAVKVMYAGAVTSIIAIAVGLAKVWACVVWLVGLAAVVLLWQRASTEFFKGQSSS